MSPSRGPADRDELCLPPLPQYQLDIHPDYTAYCREQGDQVVTLSGSEMRCLVSWFKQWHPDTLELALQYLSKQRAARRPGVPPAPPDAPDLWLGSDL